MDPAELRQTLDALAVYTTPENTSPLSSPVRILVQLAQNLDGPLRLFGPPSLCDMQTFQQHLK